MAHSIPRLRGSPFGGRCVKTDAADGLATGLKFSGDYSVLGARIRMSTVAGSYGSVRLNEFYCPGLWSDGRVGSLEVVTIFPILTPNTMLPHNDGFLLATATFIQD